MHRQTMTQDDGPRPCRECGTLLAAGDEVTLAQGESFCSGECAYHFATGGKLTLQEEIEAERFAHSLAVCDSEEVCERCGKWFHRHRDGASDIVCGLCVPILEAEERDREERHTRALLAVRFPYKLEGDRILVDADALEADKNNEDN